MESKMALWDKEAEESCIQASLSGLDDAFAIIQGLDPEDFYSFSHQLIVKAIKDLQGAGKKPDAITLRNRLAATGDLERIGGCARIIAIGDYVCAYFGLKDHARIVKELSYQRRLTDTANLLMRLSEKPQVDFSGYVAEVADILKAALTDTAAQDGKNC